MTAVGICITFLYGNCKLVLTIAHQENNVKFILRGEKERKNICKIDREIEVVKCKSTILSKLHMLLWKFICFLFV